jgi:hypothetical protein
MKLFSILSNPTTELRTTLHTENVVFKDVEVLVELRLIEKAHMQATDGSWEDKNIYIFREPYRIPKFNYLYGSKIKSPNDPYLTEAIQGLLYLNPNPTIFIKRKIAEYIVRNFSATSLQESEVRIGEMTQKAVLTYEQVHAHIDTVIGTRVMEYWQPDTQDYVMYSRDNKIPAANKREIKNELRRQKAAEYFENAIHDATEFLIEEEHLLKITPTRIRDTKKVLSNKGIASQQTIKKYMSDRTQRVLDRHNSWAPFKSETTYEKYKDYLTNCDQSSSLDQITFNTNVSKSTAVEFRKIRYGQ